MMRRLSSLVVLLSASAVAVGQTPSPLAVHDEASLRQAGIGADAASLLKLLHDHTQGKGDVTKVKALIEQLGSPEFDERERASKSLSTFGRPALDTLRQAHKTDPDPEVRLRAGHCIEHIENSLDPNLTLIAVRRLSFLRAGGAAEPLLEMLPDVDWETQDEIFHGLPRVAMVNGKVDPALLAALEDKTALRRAAAALAVAVAGGEADRARVRKLLTDSDAQVRLCAAQGLLSRYDPRSLSVLIALLDEPMVDVSWTAEELLHWAAGETAPTVTVGAASVAERKKVVTAWTEWHTKNVASLDWEQLAKTTRRPGLRIICDPANSTWLVGCDGKARWSLLSSRGGFGVHDIVLLPGNQLVIAPSTGDAQLIKCDLSGKQIWKHVDRAGEDFVVCQRLANGNFFLATDESLCELSADGKPLAVRAFDEISPVDAWQLRNGRILCLNDAGVAEFAGLNGPLVRESRLERTRFTMTNKFAVLPDGRCVVADYWHDRIIEMDQSGTVSRTVNVRGAWCVTVLRNGNYLVSTALPRSLPISNPGMLSSKYYVSPSREFRVLELDAEGRTVWEVAMKQRAGRVRPVLERVSIGFEKARPADFDLDSAATRVRGLKDADPVARRRAADFLAYLKPQDETSIAAMIAALDDREAGDQVAQALAQIGEAAIPSLLQTLKQGTDRSRLLASVALNKMGPGAKLALPELIELVRNGKNAPELRGRAALTIGSIGVGAKWAVPVLLDALKGTDDALRRQSALSLVAIAPDDGLMVARLIDALSDVKYPVGRLGAAQGLALLGGEAKAAVSALLAAVQAPDSSEVLRLAAIDALGSIGPEAKAALTPLLAILKDQKQSESMRGAAARSVGRFGAESKSATAVMTEMLREPMLSDKLAATLIKALGGMGEDGVAPLAEVVKQGTPATRRLAIQQLVELGGEVAKPALPALQEAAKDKDATISREATRAIRVITNTGRMLKD